MKKRKVASTPGVEEAMPTRDAVRSLLLDLAQIHSPSPALARYVTPTSGAMHAIGNNNKMSTETGAVCSSGTALVASLERLCSAFCDLSSPQTADAALAKGVMEALPDLFLGLQHAECSQSAQSLEGVLRLMRDSLCR